MRLLGVCTLHVALCFTVIGAFAQQKVVDSSLSLHDRIWIATQIYSAINTYFGHWRAVPDLDLDKEFQSYLDQITATDNRRTFDMATLELIAKLKNGHSGFSDHWLIDNDGQMLGPRHPLRFHQQMKLLGSQIPQLQCGLE